MLIIAGVLIVLYILLNLTSSFWVNWWWFDSMGRRSLLTDRYVFKTVSFVIGALIAALMVGGNSVLALRRTRHPEKGKLVTQVSNRIIFWLAFGGTIVVAIFMGSKTANAWDLWVRWYYGSSFGTKDPYFSRDIGFYIFTLPAITWIYRALLVLTVLTLVVTIVIYALRQSLRFNMDALKLAPLAARAHVMLLLAFLALVFAFGRLISIYRLVYSDRGLVQGPSFTDMNVVRWANLLLAILAIVLAIVLALSTKQVRTRYLAISGGALLVVFLVGLIALPVVVQRIFVNPSELKRESAYVEKNLQLTRSAYALDNVTERESSGQAPLTAETLSDEQQTIENIRLWDYRIARSAFQQLQSFVPYYSFDDVDVDKYQVDGQIQQVLTSARELDQGGLPSASQNWTNERLIYTHGYGAVVAPVSQVSSQGMPVMVVSNIPPNGTGQYTIDQPEIYFGDAPSSWIILNSQHDEFSGIDATADATRFQGTPAGGIELGGILKRLILASYLSDRNTLLSGAIKSDSILVINRSIQDRLHALTPVFSFDSDPYLVIDGGKLYWIVDGFTTSNDYPAAHTLDGLNYIRNSVKVIVDAYTGDVTYYRTDTADPIADAYGKMYKGLFRPISEAPASLAEHFRYPQKMFDIQSEIYASAHVSDANALYKGEDIWTVATETIDGQSAPMQPYYVTMRLPGETDTTYNLILPYIPGGQTNRQNMTSWLAGRMTPEGQLELVLYRFPRQETVFGPSQIEGRINQQPEIASQLSLWNQAGTQVIFGNLLVIPVDESVLYVQPLYLQSTTAEGALPELQRVIVATNEKVVMRETLDEAIAAAIEPSSPAVDELQPGTTAETPPETTAPVSVTPEATPNAQESATINSLTQQALDAFQKGQDAMQKGDWTTYGEAQQELSNLLNQIAAASGSSDSTAVPESAATPSP